MVNGVFKHNDILGKALAAGSLRNEVIMDNIANSDTPGYKKKKVNFEAALKSALDSEDIGRTINLDDVQPTIEYEHGTYSTRRDESNFDVETEMTELYKNSLRYDVMVNSVISNYKRINSAIAAKV